LQKLARTHDIWYVNVLHPGNPFFVNFWIYAYRYVVYNLVHSFFLGHKDVAFFKKKISFGEN